MIKKGFLIIAIMYSLLWFVSLRIISKYNPGGLIFGGAYYRRYFAFQIGGGGGGLVYGVAYTRRGLFSNFTVSREHRRTSQHKARANMHTN